jgi:hypothetical protein
MRSGIAFARTAGVAAAARKTKRDYPSAEWLAAMIKDVRRESWTRPACSAAGGRWSWGRRRPVLV